MAENEYLGASFSIDTTDLKAGLSQANRLIKESESKFKAAAAGMDAYSDAQKIAEARIDSLSDVTALQREKVNALQQEYDRLISEGLDPTSKQAVELRTKINNETAALNKNERELQNQTDALEQMRNASEDTEEAVEDLGEQLEDTGDKAEEAGDGFTVMKGAAADLVSKGISALVSGCKNAITSLLELSSETQEYRQQMNKLQTSFESAGKSSEFATATYKELYGVLGDEDRAVEAAAHLAQLVDSEEDMAKWTNIATGVWGKFGDSLPIEGLTEAANETVRTGELTGVLTDALNWASKEGETFGLTLKENIDFTELSSKELARMTDAQREEYEARKKQHEEIETFNQSLTEAVSAEDKFKLALAECSSEEERAQLLTETLNGMYSDSADLYRENNKAIIEARSATSDYNDAIADLGAAVEPVSGQVQALKTEFAKELVPVVKQSVLPAFERLTKEFKKKNYAEKFGKAVGWVADNFETLAKVTGIAVTVFATFAAIMKTTTAITAAKTAIAGLSAGVGFATKAQTVWNAAMSANPIGAVITAVALLAGGIALLVSKENEAAKAENLLTDSQRENAEAVRDAAEAYRDTKEAAAELAYQDTQSIKHTQDLWHELQTLTDENGNVKDGYEDRAQFILNDLNEALGTEYTMNGKVIEQYQDMQAEIDGLIEKKKAEALLNAYADSYATAVKEVAAAEKDRAAEAQALVTARENAAQAEADYAAAYAALQAKMADAKTEADYRKLASEAQRVENARLHAERANEILDEQKAKYDEANAIVLGYYADIDNYEIASGLLMQGETEKAIGYLNKMGEGFLTAANTAKLGADEQRKALEQQVIDAEINLQLLEDEYAKSAANMTEEEKRQAEARIASARESVEAAKNEWQKIGTETGRAVTDGFLNNDWSRAGKDSAYGLTAEWNESKKQWNDVGVYAAEGIAEGIDDGTVKITNAMRRAIDKAVAAALDEEDAHSPSRLFRKTAGLYIPLGIAAGIEDGTGDVIDSVKNQIKSIENAYDLSGISGNIGAGFDGQTAQGKGSGSNVTVYQTNNYSQAHSRLELFKTKQQTAAAVRLAMGAT